MTPRPRIFIELAILIICQRFWRVAASSSLLLLLLLLLRKSPKTMLFSWALEVVTQSLIKFSSRELMSYFPSGTHTAKPFWHNHSSVTRLEISDRSWIQIILQMCPRHLATFLALLKSKNYSCLFLVNYWNKMGYFLVQHLVTLLLCQNGKKCNWQKYFSGARVECNTNFMIESNYGDSRPLFTLFSSFHYSQQ